MHELVKVGDITPIDFMPYRKSKILREKGLRFALQEIAKNKFKIETGYYHFKKELHLFEVFVLLEETTTIREVRREKLAAFSIDF